MSNPRSRSVSEPLSTRLHWTAEYFRLCGYVGLLGAAGWLFTGQALRARQRVGGLAAIASLLPPLVRAITSAHGFSVGVVISALGCLSVLTSWRELE